MRLSEVIHHNTAWLEARGIESARLQVEWIVASILGIPRLQLHLDSNRRLEPSHLERIHDAMTRRARREPMQHILGSTSFCGLELEVTPDVLVPRPETEQLAERAWLEARAKSSALPTPRILDWGTGSGCLAIAIAVHCPQARITALDLSAAALEVATRNARRHACADRIRFVHGDGCDALPADARFDLVVTNPPYIPAPELETLEPEVRDFDPRTALDGGPDGLSFYRRLAGELATRLAPGGLVLMEFGDSQAPAIAGILSAAGWSVLEICRDHAGRDRFLLASRST